MNEVSSQINYQSIPKAELWSDEENFCYLVFKAESEIELSDARVIIEKAARNFSGQKFVTLVDARNIKSISSEAREFFVEDETNDIIEAVAIIVGSTHSRLLANFFINFHKPAVPTRMFTDEEKARNWLRQFLPE